MIRAGAIGGTSIADSDQSWITAKSSNLALVRLNYEAATLDPAVTGLGGGVRADQIGVWRHDIEQRLIGEGLEPSRAPLESSLVKATFSGLILDLVATGDRHRLTPVVEEWLRRLSCGFGKNGTEIRPT